MPPVRCGFRTAAVIFALKLFVLESNKKNKTYTHRMSMIQNLPSLNINNLSPFIKFRYANCSLILAQVFHYPGNDHNRNHAIRRERK